MFMRGTMPRMAMATNLLALGCLAFQPMVVPPARAQVADPHRHPSENVGRVRPVDRDGEGEGLKEEIRRLKAAQEDLRREIVDLKQHLAFAPEVEVQQEDYAQARRCFRTKLVREGPATRASSRVEPPAGVVEIEYPSGGLRLKAWLNRPTDASRKYPAVLFL